MVLAQPLPAVNLYQSRPTQKTTLKTSECHFLKRCHSLFPQKFKSIYLKTSSSSLWPSELRNIFYIIKSNLWLTWYNYHSLSCVLYPARGTPELLGIQCMWTRRILQRPGFKCANTALLDSAVYGVLLRFYRTKEHYTILKTANIL